MKRLVFFCCMWLVWALFIPGAAYSQGEAKDPLLVLNEEIFDFGTVKEGDRLSHDFIVRNDGEVPLEIHKVSPG
jgi:hypothetical protein